MLGFDKDTASLYFGIHKKINIWVIANFCLILNKKLGRYGVVIIGVITAKIIQDNPCLKKQGFFEKIIGKIKCVSAYQFGYI